jgi:sulfite reductase alpha subunit-like flavoprotein
MMNGHDESRIQNATAERCLTFLYATQTGNAQDLAESLARHAIRLHFTTQCVSLQDYTPVLLHYY